MEKFLETQKQNKAQESNETNGDSSKALIWTLYFLAQHYDHYRTRDGEKALEYINAAIAESDTTVEFYMTIARIHKHTGDLKSAMEHMNKAREIDLKDRYINTKGAKYQLRNDCNEEALKTMSLFTRVSPSSPETKLVSFSQRLRLRFLSRFLSTDCALQNEANGGPLGDLLEMQCVWYITEDAESYLRQKKLGLALKRYHAIWKVRIQRLQFPTRAL